MRSRASLSASSVAASQAFTAASISAAVTRREAASSVSRSYFCVASSRAASPRFATSSTIARAAASTSADTSRLAARKAANRWSKSALLRSRRTGIFRWSFGWSLGADRRHKAPCSMARRPPAVNPWPGRGRSKFRWYTASSLDPQPRSQFVRPQIGQLAFQAFDVEADGAALGEQQQRAAAGLLVAAVLGVKLDTDEVQNRRRRRNIDVARLAGEHAVETERRNQPARLGFAFQRLLPVQPAHADHQALLALPPDDVGGLHQGILHMGRDHREIIGVERDQFKLVRHSPALLLRCRCGTTRGGAKISAKLTRGRIRGY